MTTRRRWASLSTRKNPLSSSQREHHRLHESVLNKEDMLIAWDVLAKPKGEGGLGFRDIQDFNVAMIAKLSWRILTKPNSLLARILLGKYCHNQSFTSVACASSCSHGWRGVLKGRDLLLKHLGKTIGNGMTTGVWTNSWISTSAQTLVYGPPKEEDRDLVVSDLL